MRTLTLLIGLSLAMAGGALAQQVVEEQASPSGKKQEQEATQEKTHEKAHEKAPKTETNAGNPEAPVVKPHEGKHERAPLNAQTTETSPSTTEVHGKHAAKISAETGATTAPNEVTQPGGKHYKGAKGAATENATVNTLPSATAAPSVNQAGGKHGKGAKGAENAVVNAPASAAPSVAATGATGVNAGKGAHTKEAALTQGVVGKGGKKVEPQQLTQIKQQHTSFHAQPRPDKAPAVQFSANFRIEGADRWQGPQYEVFRAYRPERHDRGWYHSHYTRVQLIGGGYYYWNSGYWYPAWGYDPSAEYYAYNGPIYVGQRAEPPDQVIADVQAELQEMGYYQGEVDGLLGPLTRQALADYQAEHDLDQTAAIDEPTLDSLGMS